MPLDIVRDLGFHSCRQELLRASAQKLRQRVLATLGWTSERRTRIVLHQACPFFPLWGSWYRVDGDGKATRKDSVPWREALSYCDKLSFAGHEDWRLPNVRELHTLVDYGRFNPSIAPVFGAPALEPTIPLPPVFWSSTASVAGGIPWYVDFIGGSINVAGKSPCYVRAVRNAK